MSKQVHQLLVVFLIWFSPSTFYPRGQLLDRSLRAILRGQWGPDPSWDTGGVAGLLLVLVCGRNLTIKTYDLERQANDGLGCLGKRSRRTNILQHTGTV